MTIVLQGSGWHIESFTVLIVSLADATARPTTHTLEKAGVFLGGSATMSFALSANVTAGLSVVIRKVDNSELVIGDNISDFESVFFNDSGASKNVGETCFVMIRDHQ